MFRSREQLTRSQRRTNHKGREKKGIPVYSYIPFSVRVSLVGSRFSRSFLQPNFVIALAWFALSPATRAADGDLGNGNTAEGANALASLNGGFNNTATGSAALFRNTNGGFNTATGAAALNSNISGFSNTADGYAALLNNTASFNTATGSLALNYHHPVR